jgi:hypothetical protein
MAIASIHGKIGNQQSGINQAPRTVVTIAITAAITGSPVDGGVQPAAIIGLIVPIAAHVGIAVGCVAVMIQSPNPIRIGFVPVTGLPNVFAVLPEPVAGGP